MYDMKSWLKELREAKTKKPLPVLSFPGTQLMGITVKELIASSELQARCMSLVAKRCDTAASVSFMDLSVEAEAFGAEIKFSDDEVPTVIGRLAEGEQDIDRLAVPEVGAKRTGLYIEAIKKAKQLITDRPVLAGVIGPFSLAGRLMDMTEIMVSCYTEPETVHKALGKAAEFIGRYIQAFKDAGADGVVMAEPAAGLLSPGHNDEFSTRYVKSIIEQVQDDNFIVVYHNCGNTVPLIDSLVSNGAAVYHFGNAVKMTDILKLMPQDKLVMGNIDPVGQFRNGTPQGIYAATKELLTQCSVYPNYVISSGCDIPPLAPWENIDSFFKAVKDFYA